MLKQHIQYWQCQFLWPQAEFTALFDDLLTRFEGSNPIILENFPQCDDKLLKKEKNDLIEKSFSNTYIFLSGSKPINTPNKMCSFELLFAGKILPRFFLCKTISTKSVITFYFNVKRSFMIIVSCAHNRGRERMNKEQITSELYVIF